MMNKNKFVLGIAAGVAGTLAAGFGMERAQAPERDRLEYVQQLQNANALARARRDGFEDASCLAYTEGLLRPLPADRMVRAEHAPIYEVQENCSSGANNVDGRQMYVWIPTAE
jgi:hypothetical protein